MLAAEMPTATDAPVTVVIVDDDRSHLDLLERMLESALDGPTPVAIRPYCTAEEAIADLPPDGSVVIICDYRLGSATGLDWLPDFVKADVGPVIIASSTGDETIAADAFRHGAADYIAKSQIFDDPPCIAHKISEALRRFRLEHSNRDLARRLKIANLELKRKNQSLAELTETAHRFVEDVAHEFRTPLTVIKEFAAIVRDGLGGPVTEKQAEFLQFIADATRDMSHLVDDFLDSGKLRARTLRVDRREHTVQELVGGVLPMLEARAKAKRIRIEQSIPAELPRVFADAEKVGRTLVNLVVNAVKFSPADSVVTIDAASQGAAAVRFSVIDRGPGMPKEEVDRLFQRFRQGGEAGRVSTKGFGLGLNISRELVALNLGEIGVSSEPGKGSRFSFTMPTSDAGAIVDAFVARASERSPKGRLTALRLTPAPGDTREALGTFLASATHATDLQMPAPDGRSIILLGETTEPDAWRDRLLRMDEQRRSDERLDHHGAPSIEHAGAWTPRSAREAIRALTGATREGDHAKVSAHRR
ncbi:MAG: ATP-binding protein [Phycisphaerales bacterium]